MVDIGDVRKNCHCKMVLLRRRFSNRKKDPTPGFQVLDEKPALHSTECKIYLSLATRLTYLSIILTPEARGPRMR